MAYAYADHRLEQVLETSGLLAYAGCAFRFGRNKIDSLS